MSKYAARLTCPSKTDRHYYSSENIFYACGYGMPNCTAYAWGRLYEITGKRYAGLHGNAEDFFGAATRAGLKTGQIPKLGAIACWRAGQVGNGADGAGHVAVVEEIKSNGDIVVSQSAWKGTEFYLSTITKASGYVYSSNRPFQGFIYCGLDFDENAEASSSTISAGAKVILANTDCYTSESSTAPYGKKFGKFFLWDGIVKNGRTRITNKKERVGVAGQVTCWVKISDLNLKSDSKADNVTTFKLTKDCYTFWAVSRKFGCTVAEIQALNPSLNPNNLQIGQTIKIPKK